MQDYRPEAPVEEEPKSAELKPSVPDSEGKYTYKFEEHEDAFAGEQASDKPKF